MPLAEARKGRWVFYQSTYGDQVRLMATKTKRKAALRAAGAKAGRRAPVKVKSGRDLPLLPIVVAGALVVLAIGIIIYAVVNNKSSSPPAVAGIPCDHLEHTQVHYHAAIQIMYQGNVTHIPASIGIQGDPTTATTGCYYWLHVHAANPDVIHIESPATRTFTLGDFFAVWNSWANANGLPAARLDATHVANFTLTAEQKIVAYVDANDGKGPVLFTGDPRTIELKTHEVIWLEISPPTVSPPPAFTFTSGL
jgi:hypothetical protein